MADPERPQSSPDPEAGESPRPEPPPQHQMWVTQADELARLRDEVRAAAEREAMDVVTTARRRIRQVITEARRDLLILNAQLHATLGPPGPPPDAAALPPGLDAAGFGDGVPPMGPRDAERHAAVQAALDRAKAGIEALAQELDDIEVPVDTVPRRLDPQTEPVRTAQAREQASSRPDDVPRGGRMDESSVRGMPWRPHADLVPASALASPSPRGSGHRRMAAAGLAAAILLTTGLVWLWPGRDAQVPAAIGTDTPAEEFTAVPPPAETPADMTAAPVNREPEGLSIVLSIVDEPAWIRTTVDGRVDARTYEPGETRRIEGARTVLLRAGNAGAVRISVDGAPAVPMGAVGAVVNREFSLAPAATSREATAAPSAAPERSAPPEASAVAPQRTAPVPVPPAAGAAASPAPRADAPVAAAGAATGTLDVAPRTPAPVPAPATLSGPPANADMPADQAPPSSAAEDDDGDINVAIAGQQWLDAYQREDTSVLTSLASEGATIRDERQPGERFPARAPGIARQLDDVSVEFAGDIAIYTARMTERRVDGQGPEHVSRVAQIWTRRAGRWQLTDVRIMSDARVGQLVR